MSAVMDHMPFVHKRREDESRYRVDFKGITQSLVVAAIIGLAIMYSDQSKIVERLDSLSTDINEIRKNQERFQGDFYVPVHPKLP